VTCAGQATAGDAKPRLIDVASDLIADLALENRQVAVAL